MRKHTHTYTRTDLAPVAMRWPDAGVGLNSTERTGPSCPLTLESSASSPPPFSSLEGSHTFTTPSDMPPARRPREGEPAHVLAAPQVSDENRPLQQAQKMNINVHESASARDYTVWCLGARDTYANTQRMNKLTSFSRTRQGHPTFRRR